MKGKNSSGSLHVLGDCVCHTGLETQCETVPTPSREDEAFSYEWLLKKKKKRFCSILKKKKKDFLQIV